MVLDVDGGSKDSQADVGGLQVLGKGLEFVGGPGEEDECCAFGGEAGGDGGADAHRGAGDEDGLVCEGHGEPG